MSTLSTCDDLIVPELFLGFAVLTQAYVEAVVAPLVYLFVLRVKSHKNTQKKHGKWKSCSGYIIVYVYILCGGTFAFRLVLPLPA